MPSAPFHLFALAVRVEKLSVAIYAALSARCAADPGVSEARRARGSRSLAPGTARVFRANVEERQ